MKQRRSFLFDKILLACLIEILKIVLVLEPFDESFLLLLGQGIENEDGFVSYIILLNTTFILIVLMHSLISPINKLYTTLIGWVNFLPAKITNSAIHTPSRASFVFSSIKPLCYIHRIVL